MNGDNPHICLHLENHKSTELRMRGTHAAKLGACQEGTPG